MSTKSDLVLWTKAAAAIPESQIRVIAVPFHVFLGEAVDIARFFNRYWDDQRDHEGGVVHRGLCSAATRSTSSARARSGRGADVLTLTSKTGEEILELQRASQEAHTAYLLSVDPKSVDDPLARGRFLVGEIQATLTWIFPEGGTDRRSAQLANVALAHANDPESTDALAGALDDFAGLALEAADEMDGVGGFDARFIAEAKALAAELRSRPTQATALSPATRAALELRNRICSLLADRIALVRNAARFVFRDQPEIAREATSAYERRRRSASRRAGDAKSTPPPAEPPSPDVTRS
jgi:hypothetical protein